MTTRSRQVALSYTELFVAMVVSVWGICRCEIFVCRSCSHSSSASVQRHRGWSGGRFRCPLREITGESDVFSGCCACLL